MRKENLNGKTNNILLFITSNLKKILFLIFVFFISIPLIKKTSIIDGNIKYINSNTFFICSFNIDKIFSKGSYFDIINSEDGKILINVFRNLNLPRIIFKLIENPSEIGLDLKKNTYLYTTIHKSEIKSFSDLLSINFVFPVDDYKLITKNINRYIDLIPDKNIDIIDGKINEYNYILFKDRYTKDHIGIIYYNRDVFLFSLAPINKLCNVDLVSNLNSTLNGKNLSTEKSISYLKNNQLSFWVNLNKGLKDNLIIKDYYKKLNISTDLNNSYLDKYINKIIFTLNSDNEKIDFNLHAFFNFNFFINKIIETYNFLIWRDLNIGVNYINIKQLLKNSFIKDYSNIVISYLNDISVDKNLNKIEIKNKLFTDNFNIYIKEDIKIKEHNLFLYILIKLLSVIKE